MYKVKLNKDTNASIVIRGFFNNLERNKKKKGKYIEYSKKQKEIEEHIVIDVEKMVNNLENKYVK